MEFWTSFIYLGILFIVIEFFLLTLDFLALWIASICTWVVIKLFNLSYNDWWSVGFIFVIMWLGLIYLFRKFVLPRWKAKAGFTAASSLESAIGDKLIVQSVSDNNVVYHEWVYWKVFWEEIAPWDTVEVLEIIWNKFKVKKVI